MGKKLVLAVLVAALLLTIYATVLAMGCRNTGMSERFFNMIDDDCDFFVDEDFVQAECGNGVLEFGEFCDDGNTENLDGCSSGCKNESNVLVYAAPYIGNIDGDFSSEWYYVFDMITDFHTKNEINVGFSVYPASIKTGEFGRIFAKMYNSPYIEFIQKGYRANRREETLDKLSPEEQKDILKAGQDFFRKMAQKILGTENITVPVAYNQPQGRFTESIRDALRELGFKIFFELYLNEDIGPIKPLDDFDVIQYGAGITVTGEAGSNTTFKDPDALISEIKVYERRDANMVTINGKRVVPVWFHHYDMESAEKKNVLNEDKWRIYTELMLKLKQDPEIILLRPSEIYELRHQ